MSAAPGPRGRPPIRAADAMAMLWAILCCWTVVWGNYLLLGLKVGIFWIVPLDMFAVPALVTAALTVLRRRSA
jgi:hypothetical protein